ncbi:hypothetical protein HAX54_048769, partial [Datura stramonium]|nr:hypothetical protein [Datura stramonium]
LSAPGQKDPMKLHCSLGLDPLLKPNHANVMEVPGSCKIIVVPMIAHGAWIRIPNRGSMDHRRYLPMAFRLVE